jgi:hypothetical protein
VVAGGPVRGAQREARSISAPGVAPFDQATRSQVGPLLNEKMLYVVVVIPKGGVSVAVTLVAQSFGPPEVPVGLEQPRPRSGSMSPRNNGSVASMALVLLKAGNDFFALSGEASLFAPAPNATPTPIKVTVLATKANLRALICYPPRILVVPTAAAFPARKAGHFYSNSPSLVNLI